MISPNPQIKSVVNFGTAQHSTVLTANFLAVIEERMTGVVRHEAFGISALDAEIPRGLHQDHLVVIGARPSMGKTTLGQQILENVAEQGKTVLFYSIEMPSHQVVERSITRRSGLSIETLQNPQQMSEGDWGRLTVGSGEFNNLPILIDDTTHNIDAIVAKSRLVAESLSQAGQQFGAILVDYLQIVSTTREAANKNLEMTEISGKLRRLARELHVPVVALSQLNRSVEQRPDKHPLMSDLRDSGSIEQDADLILFIYRDEVYNPDSQLKGMAEIYSVKNRHGKNGIAKLSFEGERFCFGNSISKDSQTKGRKNGVF